MYGRRVSEFFVNFFSIGGVYTIEYGRRPSSGCQLERKSHDFDTAKSRTAKMDGYIRRSIGEYAPVLSIALVTPAVRFPKNTESPVSQRHRAFFVGSVAEMV